MHAPIINIKQTPFRSIWQLDACSHGAWYGASTTLDIHAHVPGVWGPVGTVGESESKLKNIWRGQAPCMGELATCWHEAYMACLTPYMCLFQVCGDLWAKQVAIADLPALQLRVIEAICLMELHLPATEADMKLHNLLHLAFDVLPNYGKTPQNKHVCIIKGRNLILAPKSLTSLLPTYL